MEVGSELGLLENGILKHKYYYAQIMYQLGFLPKRCG